MLRIIRKQLGRILVERGIITERQLGEALKVQNVRGGFLGQILARLRFATEKQVVSALTSQFGFPFLPLRNYEIDSDILKLIPSSIIERYHLIPVDKMDNIIIIAMADPLNSSAIEAVKTATNCNVRIFVSTGGEIEYIIDRYFRHAKYKRITRTAEEYMTDVNFQKLVMEERKKEEL